MDISRIECQLLQILEECRNFALPSEQIDDMAELVVAGEPRIALENLCTQLFEYDVSVSGEMLRSIKRLAETMNISNRYWTRLSV